MDGPVIFAIIVGGSVGLYMIIAFVVDIIINPLKTQERQERVEAETQRRSEAARRGWETRRAVNQIRSGYRGAVRTQYAIATSDLAIKRTPKAKEKPEEPPEAEQDHRRKFLGE